MREGDRREALEQYSGAGGGSPGKAGPRTCISHLLNLEHPACGMWFVIKAITLGEVSARIVLEP